MMNKVRTCSVTSGKFEGLLEVCGQGFKVRKVKCWPQPNIQFQGYRHRLGGDLDPNKVEALQYDEPRSSKGFRVYSRECLCQLSLEINRIRRKART